MGNKEINQKKLSDMFSKGAYDYFYEKEFEKVYDHVVSLIRLGLFRNILDVGCWTGMLADALERADYDGNYCGFDLCKEAIEKANQKKYSFKSEFKVQSWDRIEKDKQYDVIYFGGVFYYLQENKKLFYDIYRKAYLPRLVIIQDLMKTDLSYFQEATKKIFYLNIKTNEERKFRQVISIV
jgi:predicted TPR repeat methyltransferase